VSVPQRDVVAVVDAQSDVERTARQVEQGGFDGAGAVG
jgi:hypothetical protein